VCWLNTRIQMVDLVWTRNPGAEVIAYQLLQIPDKLSVRIRLLVATLIMGWGVP